MNSTTLREFEEYYESFNAKEYDIQRECMQYCVNDVMVLRICFDEYRDQIIDEFDIDPALSANTIASLVHRIFRKSFMPEKKIGIIDRNITHNYSFQAIGWLEYCKNTMGIENLNHARNGGEVVIKAKNKLHYADGYCIINKVKTVFFFHGCYYHGHTSDTCPLIDQERYLGELSHTDRYARTMRAEARLRAENYNVITMWECEWTAKKKELMEDGKTIGTYVKELLGKHKDKILHAGPSLFGGRTNPFVYYYPPTPGVKIHYMDFTSLYPYVQKNNYFPVGKQKHIRDITDVADYISKMEDEYFGLSYLTLFPPKDLYMPVIPVSMNQKLVFPLCMKCSEESLGVCTHTDEERAISGVYTTPEIKMALEKGYKILNVFEVWAFEKDDTLFKAYVNHFLKKKTEASGYPSCVVSEADKDAYIRSYEEYEGIKLEKSMITKNPGRRFIAKLALNSLWGKFAQRLKNGNMKLCKDDYEAEQLASDGRFEVTQLDQIFQGYLAKYNHTDYSTLTSSCTNIPIAAFTTAYARVKLYRLLDSLGERVLYTDTDSVIFTTKEGEYMPQTGVYLGELTDEITDEYGMNAYADSFVSTGPKSYAVRIRIPQEDGSLDSKFIVRSKGICMNPDTKEIINFDTMVSLVADNGAINAPGAEKQDDSDDDGGVVAEKIKERPLSELDKKWYAALEKDDVTVHAINDIIGEVSIDNHEESMPHTKNNQLNDKLVAHMNVNTESGALQFLVPNSRFQAGKFGGMVALDGTKLFQVTGKKRYLIPGTFRSVPYGYNGDVHPI